MVVRLHGEMQLTRHECQISAVRQKPREGNNTMIKITSMAGGIGVCRGVARYLL